MVLNITNENKLIIYQIHCIGEESDYIVGSFLFKDKAKEFKEELEKEQERKEKCNKCPIYFCEDECDFNCNECQKKSIEKVKEYCNNYESNINDEYCKNFKVLVNEKSFLLKKVEVSLENIETSINKTITTEEIVCEENLKIKETIERLKQYLDYGISIGMDEQMQKDYRIAINSIEKQLCKEPIVVGKYTFCPTCGSFKPETYCQKCGQKIKINN